MWWDGNGDNNEYIEQGEGQIIGTSILLKKIWY